MKKLIILLQFTILAGCDNFSKPDQSSKSDGTTTVAHGENTKANFVRDLSNVYKAEGVGLFTLNYDGNAIQTLFNDVLLNFTLGDVDEVNSTANLKDANGNIWTLKQVWNLDKTAYHVELIDNVGETRKLSLVRKITTDDKNRINDAINRRAAAEAEYSPPREPSATEKVAPSAVIDDPQESAETAEIEAKEGMTAARATTAIAEKSEVEDYLFTKIDVVSATESVASLANSKHSDCISQKLNLYVNRYNHKHKPAESKEALHILGLAAEGALNTCKKESSIAESGIPSFDCSKSEAATEKTICNTKNLAMMDVKLDNAVSAAKKMTTNKRQIVEYIKQWIANRNSCGDEVGCIESSYTRALNKINEF